jgi:hypothetical protein
MYVSPFSIVLQKKDFSTDLKLQSTTVPYNSRERAKVGVWKLGTGASSQGKMKHAARTSSSAKSYPMVRNVFCVLSISLPLD